MQQIACKAHGSMDALAAIPQGKSSLCLTNRALGGQSFRMRIMQVLE